MQKVTSKDGTSIAFDKVGEGPALILVTGATGVRAHSVELAELLAKDFTVFNYDRRGRGDSGDTSPYAVEREVEDIEAVIEAAGGSAFVHGMSSGAVLALEAASQLPTKISKLALYEPPFILDNSRPPLPSDYVARLNQAVAEGRRDDAAEIFLRDAINLPAEYLEPIRQSPNWASMEQVAHTIAYDGTIMGDTMSGKPLSPEVVERWSKAAMPVLVMNGGLSEGFFLKAAETLTALLPDAQHKVLPDQDHGVASGALAPVLREFFLA